MIKESKQKRALLAIIAILFLANVATMAMLFSQKPGHKKEERSRNNMSAYLNKELNFTPAQLSTFDSLHTKHMREVESMLGDMKQEKQNRFKHLAEQHFNDSVIAAAAATMAVKQETLETKMLRHLRDVRDLGNARQKAKFDTTFLAFIIREKEKKKKLRD